MLEDNGLRVDWSDNDIKQSLRYYNHIINNLELIKTCKDVLKLLVFLTLNKGKAYPSQTTIGKFSGKSERTVRNALSKLEAKGLIVRKNRSHLKTRIYKIQFETLNQVATSKQASFKNFSSEIAGEIAAKEKINNKLKIAKARDDLKNRKEGKGTCETLEKHKEPMIDLSQTLSHEVLETIVQEVNTTANKSFSQAYFVKSIEKLKAIDLKKGKGLIISLRVLIKRLIGWVKRELMNFVEETISASNSENLTTEIQYQEDISADFQKVCNDTQGNHPKKLDIIKTLRTTFERFDRSLSFKSWFKNFSIEEGEGGAVLLKWPTSFDRDWVKNHFGTEIRFAFNLLKIQYELVV